MTVNAKYIYSFFIGKGWTSNSICGLLGNMQGESGIIADLNEAGGGGGYGLVQWTPKSVLTNWASQNGLSYSTVDTQCRRIQWELANGQQFYSTSTYPMTFKQFTQSVASPTYLAAVFIRNYERPANANQPQRGVWAESWYNLLSGGTPAYDMHYYNLSFQKWYNDVTQTAAPLVEDGVYGPATATAYINMGNYIKGTYPAQYCLNYQIWYNAVTQTAAPLVEDGVYGSATATAYTTMGKILNGTY